MQRKRTPPKRTPERTPPPEAAAGAIPKPKDPRDVLKAGLLGLLKGPQAAAFREGVWERHRNDSLVRKGPGEWMFAPLCLQVGDVIAKAYRDGVFAAGRFAELRPQIAVHYSGGGLHEANMTVAVVCWLRERGHEIAGGWAKEIQQIADALAMEQTKANSGRPRRRRQTKSILPLTKRQNEVVAMVAQCNGNIAEAARRLGRTPKTVREAYAAARGKLRAAGVALSKSGKAKTHRLLEDHRGQIFLAGQDDGPAHIGPRPDVPRDLRRG